MSKCNKGITLIECLIYLFLTGVLASLTAVTVINFYDKVGNSFKNLKEIIDLSIVAHTLHKDIKQSSVNSIDWIKMENDSIVFFNREIQKDIGYILKANKIYRYTGNYSKNKWHNRAIGVLAIGISDKPRNKFHISFNKDQNYINYIEVILKKENVELDMALAPFLNREYKIKN